MTDTLIKLRRSAVPGKIPTDSQLQLGEVAINTYDGKMFYKQASTSNTILQVATTSLDLSQFATTTSAQLASVISNETGTGSLVFGTSPTLVTPVINGNTTFDSGTLFIDSVNNRVGVSTISPTQALHVVGNARITGGIADSNGNFGTPGQVLASNTSGIYWTSAAVGTNLSTISTSTTVTINSDTGSGAIISGSNNTTAGVVTAGDQTFAGVKSFTSNTIFDTDTLFVDAVNNRVGVGTSTPSERLHVEGNARALSFTSANGSVSAPAFDFAADTNTGMFLAAADTIGFATNGTTAAQITSTGNLRLFNTAGTRYTEITTQPTANNTLTLPTSGNITLVSGTMVTTDTTQTISGSKTFSSPIKTSFTPTEDTYTGFGDGISVSAPSFPISTSVIVSMIAGPQRGLQFTTTSAGSNPLQFRKIHGTFPNNVGDWINVIDDVNNQTISGSKTFTQNVVISSDSTGALTLNRSTDDKYVGTTYTTAGTARWVQYIANTAAADMIFQSRDAAGAVVGAALVLRNSSQRTDAIGTLGIFGGGGGTYFTNITNPALSANRTLTLADGNTTLVSGTMVPTTGTGATGTWAISVTGNATTVTNGVYTTGNQIIDGAKTFTTAINSERPTDFWTSGTGRYYKVSNLGGLSTEGNFAVSITSNGYRKNDETWQSYGANGLNGASQITLNPDGNIYFRTDTTLASGNTQVAPTIRATIDGSGNMGIGTTTPSTKLQVSGEVTAVDYNTTSDLNVKKNIQRIDDAVFKVLQINGVTFNFIDDPDEQRHAGVIAQDVEKVLPEAVKELDNGIKHVAYGNLIGLLVEAIKEQQKQIDDLRTLINK